MPPIDDLPAPPPAFQKTSSIDDLPPPPSEDVPYSKTAGAAFLSFPFAHHIGAGAKTGLDVVTGKTPISEAKDQFYNEKAILDKDMGDAQAANPKTALLGNLASMGMLGASTGGGPYSLSSPIADTGLVGAAQGLSDSKADLSKGEIIPAAWDTARGYATGRVLGDATDQAIKVASSMNPVVVNYLKNLADKKYLKAWGATGSQLEKSGASPLQSSREDILKGLRESVGPLSTPGDIAETANESMQASGANIGDILKNRLKGVTVNRNDVVGDLNDQIANMANREDQSGLMERLGRERDNILAKVNTSGQNEVPIDVANQIKGGYQDKVNWKSLDPNIIENNANTTVSDSYRNRILQSVTNKDPEIGAELSSENQNYGTKRDIRDVAQKRQNQLDQSRHSGWLAPVSERLPSMQAVGTDFLADIVKTAPEQLGKWAKTLVPAAERGTAALTANDFLLQQTDPEYREHMRLLQNQQNGDRTPADH